MTYPPSSRRDWLKATALLGTCAALPVPTFAADAIKWTDRPAVQLKGLRVTCSEPVLVKRSRWYCWFPSLIRQPDGTLWAVMNAYADMHVSDSFSYLSRSRDGGLTWDEPRVIGDAGLSHLILADGSAVVIPYYLRPRARGTIGAPCNVISPKGQLTMRVSGVTVGNWPKPPKSMGADLATAGFVFNGQVVRGRKDEYLTTLYGHFEGDKRYSLVFAESADGFKWSIRSVVSGADCALAGGEGPCESAICRLKDGRLMCIFRLAGYVPYGQSFSEDDGKTWSKPVAIPPHSVEPSLAVMAGGLLALSGGRPGISVWFDRDGKGGEWQAVDILPQHNASRPQDAINPGSRSRPDLANQPKREASRGFTSSYTELIRLDEHHLLLIYDRLGVGWKAIPDHSPETNSVWVMRLTLQH